MRHVDIRREMTALVRRWPSSGDTQAAFAARHRISRTKLRYWLRRVAPKKRRSIDFAPVQVIPPAGHTNHIEIVLATGDRVLVSDGVSAASVHTVISVLRRSC
jgi:hypothetical protein